MSAQKLKISRNFDSKKSLKTVFAFNDVRDRHPRNRLGLQ